MQIRNTAVKRARNNRLAAVAESLRFIFVPRIPPKIPAATIIRKYCQENEGTVLLQSDVTKLAVCENNMM